MGEVDEPDNDQALCIAKWRVDSVTKTTWGETVTLFPVTESGIPENKRFHEATPGGKIEMTITNKALFGEFQPGQFYKTPFLPSE